MSEASSATARRGAAGLPGAVMNPGVMAVAIAACLLTMSQRSLEAQVAPPGDRTGITALLKQGEHAKALEAIDAAAGFTSAQASGDARLWTLKGLALVRAEALRRGAGGIPQGARHRPAVHRGAAGRRRDRGPHAATRGAANHRTDCRRRSGQPRGPRHAGRARVRAPGLRGRGRGLRAERRRPRSQRGGPRSVRALPLRRRPSSRRGSHVRSASGAGAPRAGPANQGRARAARRRAIQSTRWRGWSGLRPSRAPTPP